MTPPTATEEQEIIEVKPINVKGAELAMIEAELMMNQSKNIVIKNDDDRKLANATFNLAREGMKKIEEERKKITVPLNNALDAVNALFKRPYNFFKEARDTAEKACISYDSEKERIRLAEEARLREIARKEEERLRKIKEEQERAWREKEAKARAEEARLQAEIANAKNEKARAEAEAAAAKAREDAAKAAAKAAERAQQAAEVFVPAPTLQQAKVEVSGEKNITRWDYEITDMDAIPDDFWCLDEQKLAKFARDTKGTVKVAGIRFIPMKKLS